MIICSISLIIKKCKSKPQWSHPLIITIIKKTKKKIKAYKDPEKGELDMVGNNVNQHGHYRKQYGSSSKHWKWNGTRFISKGNEINISKKYPHSHIYWSTYQNIQGIESKEYHVKWHKSDVEGQITCSHTFVEVKKKLTSQKRVE